MGSRSCQLQSWKGTDYLGSLSWEEGSGHAGLLAYVWTMGPRLSLARVGLVHSPLSPPIHLAES